MLFPKIYVDDTIYFLGVDKDHLKNLKGIMV
jgi:hypothetical protein